MNCIHCGLRLEENTKGDFCPECLEALDFKWSINPGVELLGHTTLMYRKELFSEKK